MSEPCNGGSHCQEGVEGEKTENTCVCEGGSTVFYKYFCSLKKKTIRVYSIFWPYSSVTIALHRPLVPQLHVFFFIIVVIDSSLSLISTTHIPHSAWGYSHPLGDEQPASGQIPKGE